MPYNATTITTTDIDDYKEPKKTWYLTQTCVRALRPHVQAPIDGCQRAISMMFKSD